MKKFEGMLFCTDLDGTLYDDTKRVSKRNLDAIEYFKAEGGLFTFITGRVPKTSMEIYELIRPNAPFGCINGGGIYDGKTGEYLWSEDLPPEAMELVRVVDNEFPDVGIQLNTKKEIYFNKENSVMEWFRKVTGMPKVSCHYEDVKEPVQKVVFGHEEEARIEELKERLNEHPYAEYVDFIRAEKMLYEILPKGISKGVVLLKMAKLLGVSADKTIAIGDYNNDVSMIKAARCGIAVANAVAEAKEVASYITVSNNEDAIAVAIESIEKGKFVV